MTIQQNLSRHLAQVALYELKGIKALHPELKTIAINFLNSAYQKGFDLTITETFRTAAKQQEYYNQGRVSAGSIITNAKPLQSYHQFCLSFDVAFKGAEPYPKNMDIWKKVGELGESMGLQWGGRFNDNPHFQYVPNADYEWKNLIDYFKI